GSFSVSSSILPFDFQNTLNFTNAGIMTSVRGYRFDTILDNGTVKRAGNFINQVGGEVTSTGCSTLPAILTADATHIVNRGLLSISQVGVLRLTGRNMDLSRGALEVGSTDAGGSGLNYRIVLEDGTLDTNVYYFPAAGIREIVSDIGTNRFSPG